MLTNIVIWIQLFIGITFQFLLSIIKIELTLFVCALLFLEKIMISYFDSGNYIKQQD